MAFAIGLSSLSYQHSANASVVLIQEGTVFGSSSLNSFYNGLSGVTSSTISAGLNFNSTTFTNVDLFVAAPPTNAYTAGEITSLVNFVSGGGTAFLMGENSGFPTSNNAVNSILSAAGSSLSITPASISGPGGCSINASTGGALVGATMAGVSSFSWGCGSIVNGGTAELFLDDLSTVMMASDIVGSGIFVVMGDGNVQTSGAGNQQFFTNLLSLSTSIEVMEPGTLGILGLGLAGIGFARRKRTA